MDVPEPKLDTVLMPDADRFLQEMQKAQEVRQAMERLLRSADSGKTEEAS